MEICVVRHPSVGVSRDICYGQSDVPLSDHVDGEIQQIVAKIPFRGDALFSSPLTRCTRLAEAFDRAYQTDDRLMEIHLGDWEMQPFSSIGDAQVKEWFSNLADYQPPKGESYRMFFDRVRPFIEALSDTGLERVVIIAHDGIIRCFLMYCAGIPIEQVFQFRLDYGAVNGFNLTVDRGKVLYLNR